MPLVAGPGLPLRIPVVALNLTPADIILVRMTSDSTRPPGQRYNYRHAIDGLVKLVKEEGFGGLMEALDNFEKHWLGQGEIAAKLVKDRPPP